MTIKYISSGDKFKASQLWGEARHQLSILKNLMSFQKLKQLQRIVRFDNGTIIKCLSCFDQDVVEVFVPILARKEELPKKISLTKYFPAFEAYDGFSWRSNFVGVVLCKGGGFNPPYEFVPKESLPRDSSSTPKPALPEERKWHWPTLARKFEDIAPKGIASVRAVNKKEPAISTPWSGGYSHLSTNSSREMFGGFWRYFAVAGAESHYSRTESLDVEYGFSCTLPGDPWPGYWPDYFYNGSWWSGGRKPCNLLSLDYDLRRTVKGGGSNNIIVNDDYPEVSQYAAIWVIDFCLFGICYGHYEEDPSDSVTFESIEAKAIEAAHATGEVPPSTEYSFISRYMYHMGDYHYTYLDDIRNSWFHRGCAMDAEHYALVFSVIHDKDGEVRSRPVADLGECLTLAYDTPPDDCHADISVVKTDEKTEGPLNVVIDGVVFELFPEAQPEDAPRFQWSSLKYFRVGDRSIGLFQISKNYSYPLDYMYVYAEVIHNDSGVSDEGQTCIVTPVPIGRQKHKIPDVSDADGNSLYGQGRFRLICERKTINMDGTLSIDTPHT